MGIRNSLIFFTNAYPATLIIYADRVETHNASHPHGYGPLDPLKFTPFQKNPLLSRFFIQIGRVDELGSGVINVNRYISDYSGRKNAPQFIEGDVFKTIIPLGNGFIAEGINGEINGEISGEISGEIKRVYQLILINEGIKAKDIAKGVKRPKKTVDKYIKKLKDMERIYYKGSKKTGGYYVKKENPKRLTLRAVITHGIFVFILLIWNL